MKQRNRPFRPQQQQRLRLRPLAFSLICAGVAPAMAQVVLPGGFMPAPGSGVTMSQTGNVMNIRQPMQRGIVNWQTFSIGAGGTVDIAQPSTRAVLLNRVVGDGLGIQASRIDGTLKTSLIGNPALPGGSVFLINPSGIVFGRGASVNVGGLVASTLDIANDRFMPAGSQDKAFGRNEELLFVGPSGSMAQVKVEGGASITASPGGTIALLGGVVRNEGEINVARGSVGLVSASKVTLNLDFDGDGLTTFKIPADGQTTFKLAQLQQEDPTAVAQLANGGKVAADGGRVVLMASAANVDARQLVVSQTGVIQARSLSSRNGEIVLDAGSSANDTSEMRLGGTLDVSGSAAGVAGGSVTARGDYVRLSGLDVDASGNSGGTVSVKAVGALNMAPDATISANATGANGAGGTVALDAARTHVSGAISARGAGSGTGGTIGTSSGALQVSASARIDAAGGASGANGQWNVAARSDLNVDEAVPAYDAAGYGNFAGGTHVSAKAVGNALGRASDVRLSTGSVAGEAHDVVFQDDVALLKSQGRDARLTVDSLRDVRMNNGSSIGSTAGALHVDFDANASNNELGGAVQLDGATIATNGGNIRFYGQGKADTGYAVGGVASIDGSPYSGRAGITVTDSTLSTCAAGAGAACGGTGAITLRGQGVSQETGEDANYRISSDGVVVLGSDLRTGAGRIAIDGKGGIGANGVRLGSTENQGTTLRTGTGDVNITGTSRSWTPDDPVAVYASRIATSTLSAPDVTMANTAGVSMGAVTIAAGGRVGIDGTGSDIRGLLASSAFVTSAAAANGGTGIGFGPGDGVSISGGSISAGKGRDVSIAGTGGGGGFVVNNGGTVVQGQDASAVQLTMEAGETVRAEGGRVSLDGRGGDVRVARVSSRFEGPGLAAASAGNAVLDVSSTTGAGGTVSITGRNVLVDDVYDTLPTIDAGGAGQAGSIGIQASKTIAIGGDASLRADANSAAGNGGTVRVIAGDTLRAYGSLSARGGAAGGNGGSIETSAPHFALQGLRVDASAPVGLAGTWTIDPFNVTIAHGTGPGSLTGNPFAPMANSTVQDGDINAALDKGTSVTITTGTGGNAVDGNITFDTLAAIQRTTGGAPVTFQLDAAHNINGGATNTIQSADGALNVVFNAGVGGQGGAINFGGTIATNGGNVTMTADAGASSGSAIALNGTRIDTRATATGDAGPGGSVQLNGRRTLPGTIVNTVPTVDLTGVSIQTSTGDVSITGIGQHGDGVRIQNGTAPSQILTTGGDIDIVGIGASYSYSGSQLSVQSVEITGATVIRSIDGNIGIRGLVTPGPLDAPSGGVLVAGTTLLTTLGVGNIDIAGESQANGAGVTVGTGARVNGNNNVVLRAANNGTTDALVLGGNVRAGNVLNLRPGGVDAAGNAVDRTAAPITLGGTAATGFAVSAAEFARLDAPTIVAGSNAHAGDIDVVGPLSVPTALTLQNGAGGNIRLGGAVTAAKLGLVSRGDITQTAGAPITAGTLLARSTGGSVLLDQAPNNVSADTLGGGAAGAFRYVDVDTVQLGSVSVTGFDAAGNAPQVVSATSMAADTVFVRTLSGDLLLGTGVSSVNGVDLVAGARFQNPGGYTITGAPWRVWADTWLGETRGGLQGSGLYPNLYHCAYSGLCAVSIPAGANHFIYAQQPLATVVIGNASRPFGFPNPLFSYGIGGLILGDTGAGFAGFLFSPALQSSRQGAYPINGTFTSAEGYAVNVVPGSLFVGGLPALPRPDTLRDLPATWVYDRNIGPPPICFATGTLDGDRAAQGGDVLAREWSRVRSRPNLSSCVDTEKRNGCADF